MRAAAVLAALLLAACGEQARDRPAEPDKAAAAAPEAATAGLVVALDAEGLRLVDPRSGSATPLAFELDRDLVVRAVGRASGIAPQISSMAECLAGPMDFARFGSLTVNFATGSFAGWSLQPGEPAFTTMDGIGVGTTRNEVEASRTIAPVVDSTLGYEFTTVPGSADRSISMIFDGPGPEAKVETLWAGLACNFR